MALDCKGTLIVYLSMYACMYILTVPGGLFTSLPDTLKNAYYYILYV